jgi:hypothetical protein
VGEGELDGELLTEVSAVVAGVEEAEGVSCFGVHPIKNEKINARLRICEKR